MSYDYAVNEGVKMGAQQAGVNTTTSVGGTAAGLGISNALMGGFYSGIHASDKISTAKKFGKNLMKASPMAIIGGAIAAPAQYAADKATEKYKNDKKFNAGHFAEQAVPAAATAYLTAGTVGNLIKHAPELGKGNLSATDFVKKTLAPSAIHSGFKREVSTVKKSFDWKNMKGGKWGIAKGLAGGIVSGALLGMDMIAPAQYAGKLFKSDKDKKGKQMEKQAGLASGFRKSFKEYREAKKLLKKQDGSKVHRPDLVENTTAAKNKAKGEMINAGSKVVGGTALAGYTTKSVYDSAKNKLESSKRGLGHRGGAEYGGIII